MFFANFLLCRCGSQRVNMMNLVQLLFTGSASELGRVEKDGDPSSSGYPVLSHISLVKFG